MRLAYACNGGLTDNPITNNSSVPFDWAVNGALVTRLKGTSSSEVQKLEQATTADMSNGDGTSNTILLAENHYLDQWNYPSSNVTSEFYCAIVWQDNPSGTPIVGLDTPFLPGPQLNVAHARPSSLHPGGFQVVMCDGRTAFISDAISYDVYCKLMTSNGRKYKQAGMTTPYSAGVVNMQSTPLSDDTY